MLIMKQRHYLPRVRTKSYCYVVENLPKQKILYVCCSKNRVPTLVMVVEVYK